MAKSYSVGIVGESNYQKAITEKLEGTRASLVHEPDNPYDDRAIRVDNHRGQTIGYLPRGSWLTSALIDQGKAVTAVVGFVGREETTGNFGVSLDVTLSEQGTAGTEAQDNSEMVADQVGKVAYGCIALIILGLLALMMSVMG